MWLNLNDPDSIVAWWQVFPDQHQNVLDYKLRSSPQFAPAIIEALRRIDSDPTLSSLRSRHAPRVRYVDAYQGEPDADVAANDALHGEYAAA